MYFSLSFLLCVSHGQNARDPAQMASRVGVPPAEEQWGMDEGRMDDDAWSGGGGEQERTMTRSTQTDSRDLQEVQVCDKSLSCKKENKL